MNDPAAAARELERLAGMGLPGALVLCDVENEPLTADRFTPFWEAADALRAVIFLHPQASGGYPQAQFGDYHLANLVGNPLFTFLAAAHLCLSGYLDRYPKVRLVLAHGGGSFPYQVGRLDHGYQRRREAHRKAQRAPSSYLTRFYYDSIVFHRQALRFLIDLVGPERVLLGSDQPFDMADWPPSHSLDRVPALQQAARDRITWKNALVLLGDAAPRVSL